MTFVILLKSGVVQVLMNEINAFETHCIANDGNKHFGGRKLS